MVGNQSSRFTRKERHVGTLLPPNARRRLAEERAEAEGAQKEGIPSTPPVRLPKLRARLGRSGAVYGALCAKSAGDGRAISATRPQGQTERYGPTRSCVHQAPTRNCRGRSRRSRRVSPGTRRMGTQQTAKRTQERRRHPTSRTNPKQRSVA